MEGNFKGIFTALLTPFEENNKINRSALEALVKHNVKMGADGFYVCGSTAEAFLLTTEERVQVMQIVKETAPEQTNYPIGKYGKIRLDYLKKHRRGTYTTLLTSCTLKQHLYETEQEAKQQINLTLSRLVKERDITEELKATDPLRWAQEINNAKQCAEEIVLNELIYH